MYVLLCLVPHLCPTLQDPMDCSPPGSSVHEIYPGKNTRVGCHAPPLGDLPNQGFPSCVCLFVAPTQLVPLFYIEFQIQMNNILLALLSIPRSLL